MNEENNFTKFFAGTALLISTFLLMFSISQRNLLSVGFDFVFMQGAGFAQTTIIPAENLPITPVAEITEGSFDLGSEGDIKEETEQEGLASINHYRAVHSAKIKNSNKTPSLKLETLRNKNVGWKSAEISGIDKEKGVIYFLFKTENDEGISLHDYYTGSYQIIFE